MITLNRRNFLALSGATGISLNLAAHSRAATPTPNFSFLFITDTHLQPELNAAQGCAQCFQQARKLRCDFAIQGGDHVFDALGVSLQRAQSLFDLYGETEQALGMRLYHTLGNHDCFGIYTASGAATTDPLYGKKLFAARFGKTYYSFDHKGVHFIVLDSIGITSDRAYEGLIDTAQLDWLSADLRALPAQTPIVVSTHIPLVTAFSSYVAPPAQPSPHHSLSVANAHQVIALFEGHNVLAVLQGHTHINETVTFNGVPYITGGAVSGNWWHGIRMGTPEGFTVVRIQNGKLSTHYETYGFQSVAPEKA